MRKIKVLRIIARLNIGGPAIHTVLLTAYLDKSRFETLLVTGSVSPDEGDMAYYARQHGVTPYYIPELGRELHPVHDFVAFIKIISLLRREKPDILHTHTAKAGVLGRLACLVYSVFSGKRIILIHTFHGHILSGYFNTLANKCFAGIESFLAQFSAKIITVSESVRQELISLHIAKKDKIQVIPLGFELNNFLKIAPLPKRDTFTVGIVGRLVPIKNHRMFLEAAAKVIKEVPGGKVAFKIIGDGQLRGELEGYVRQLNLEGRVNFTGWEKDLEKAYSDLDVVALTSLNEGTPVSIIEAMAAARPVVATNVGGVADLLGEKEPGQVSTPNFKVLTRGILVEPGNAKGLAEALLFIKGNGELRQALGERARDFARNNFTKERLLKDIAALYTTLAA